MVAAGTLRACLRAVGSRRVAARAILAILAILALAVLALHGIAGCSGEWSFALPPIDAAVPDLQYEAPCRHWARAICDYEARCSEITTWADTAQCVDRIALECELAVDDPHVVVDVAGLAGCELPSDCSSPLPECWRPGTAATGTPCLYAEACRSGGCEGAGQPDSVCGICMCDVACPMGQACAVTADGGSVCLALPAAGGQPCTAPADCASTVCVGSGDAGAGTCAPLGGPGDTCGPGQPICGVHLYCDSTERCASLVWVGYGEPCGFPGDGGVAAECLGEGTCVMSTCQAPAADGEPCDAHQGTGCLWPAQCIAQRCVFPTVADCAP
jgi:hypothetical protein